jgi:hypothetical protein
MRKLRIEEAACVDAILKSATQQTGVSRGVSKGRLQDAPYQVPQGDLDVHSHVPRTIMHFTSVIFTFLRMVFARLR